MKKSLYHFKNAIIFAFLWLMVGFTMGTETLMGPVRWIADLSGSGGWEKSFGDLMVKLVIILFVILSGAVSLLLTRVVIKTRLKHVRLGLPLLILIITVGSVYFWLNPQNMGIDKKFGRKTVQEGKFSFGPYPTKQRFLELKKSNYTAVISLLHPAVVPFEPRLLEKEKKTAEKVGIQLIHIPMLPWVSDNKKPLERIKAIVEKNGGQYYVHCYLGKDRINVVKRIIEKTSPEIDTRYSESGESMRKIENISSFERGKIFFLADDVYVSPYPTDEEFMGFILSGNINQVVSLLNPSNPQDKPWIEKERKLLKQYQIPFHLFPVSLEEYNPQQVLKMVREVWQLPRPLVVHGFLSPSFRTEAFIQAFRSNRPPLPPSLFKRSLERGKIEVIAPHIAAGPRPAGPEFYSPLYRNGIRKFVFMGDYQSEEAKADSKITKRAGLDWQYFKGPSEGLYKSLSRGGPWYLYGPLLPSIKEDLTERFGPTVPEKVKFDPKTLKTPGTAQKEKEISWTEKPLKSIKSPKNLSIASIISFIKNFLIRALPDLKMVLLLAPLLLLYTGLGGAFVGWLRIKRKIKAPYTRKIFHFYIFTMAGILQLTIGLPAVVMFGVIVSLCVFYALFRGNHFSFYEAMARPTDQPHRTFFIIVPLFTTALGGGVINMFFSKFAYVGYFVGGWGDAVGEPVGTKWGKHKYQVPSLLGVSVVRSLEGSISVILASFLIAFLSLWAGGISLIYALFAGAGCAVVGSIVEAVSNHGIDNFTIQVSVAATASFLLS